MHVISKQFFTCYKLNLLTLTQFLLSCWRRNMERILYIYLAFIPLSCVYVFVNGVGGGGKQIYSRLKQTLIWQFYLVPFPVAHAIKLQRGNRILNRKWKSYQEKETCVQLFVKLFFRSYKGSWLLQLVTVPPLLLREKHEDLLNTNNLGIQF